MSKASAFEKFVNQTNISPATAVIEEAAPTETDVTAVSPTDEQKNEELPSSRFAIIAKKEAAVLREREQLKKEREQLLKEKAEADHYRSRGKDFDETFKVDKIAAFKKLGFSDTDILNIFAEAEANKTAAESPEEVARKIAAEEAQKIRDELAKERADAEKEQNERLIGKLKTDISSLIKAESEKYEYCAFYSAEAEAQAYEIIVENLKTNGELLSVDEALAITEELYEERDKAMSTLKKRQPKPAENPIEEPQQQARTRTHVGQPPVSNVPQNAKPAVQQKPLQSLPRRETPEQKKQRLIAALRNGGL